MGELTKSVVLAHTPNFFNGKSVWYGMVWYGMVWHGRCMHGGTFMVNSTKDGPP